MAKRDGEKKTGQKTLRMHGRIAFAVELIAAVQNKSETAVIETAILEHVTPLLKARGLSLTDLFHPHEGVRTLRLYLLRDFPLDDAHEIRRGFVMEHKSFFFREVGGELTPNVPNVETLWARVDEFRTLGVKRYWSSGEAMAKALAARGIDPPVWPPKGRAK